VIQIARNTALWAEGEQGGLGGSVSILAADLSSAKRSMIRKSRQRTSFQNIPIYLSRFGLPTWEASA
jgi:hypothetical protein